MSNATDALCHQAQCGGLSPLSTAALKALAVYLESQGAVSVELQTASFAGVKNTRYVIDDDSLVCTLPASPAFGDSLWFVATDSVATDFAIDPGGNNIAGSGGSVAITTPLPFAFGLCYTTASFGWAYIDSNL